MRIAIKFILMLAATWIFWGNNIFPVERSHGEVKTEAAVFIESNRQLRNPNRGFYMMYGFVPSDEEKDVYTEVTNKLRHDGRMLVMIQINLRNYTKGPITEQGLNYIDQVFQTLRTLDRQYIVRFLYDWAGKNAETEPQNVEIILEHMRQLEDIFRKYSDIIFIQQGLFIGNWGEMNGTKHLDYIPQLALQLAAVTDDKTFLAVRMPAQWRKATGIGELTEEARYKSSLVRRLSLFNDGIMGNTGDYGTYGTKSKTEMGIYRHWNREEELAFQEELCTWVPNGGEVINENPVNDFENAIRDLRRMHLTYLNWDYDRKVLNKWADSTYTGDDCFNGMDGLNYVERHLGYRLFIADNAMEYNTWQDILTVSVKMKNVGFAPMYKEPEACITVRNKENGEKIYYVLKTDLCSLAGGNESEETLTIAKEIALSKFLPGVYEVFLSFTDKDSGCMIELAHEQEPGEFGYKLGEFSLEEKTQEEGE